MLNFVCGSDNLEYLKYLKVAGTLSDTSLQLENINNGSGIKRFIFDKCIHEWS